jgi:hypothetical protein
VYEIIVFLVSAVALVIAAEIHVRSAVFCYSIHLTGTAVHYTIASAAAVIARRMGGFVCRDH